MSTEAKPNLQLEIGHVLFIDIVGYSKRLIDDQRELQQQLNQVVRDTAQFRVAETAGKLVRLPTGDGMALMFSTSPEAPVQCALEISQALRSHPQLQVRMGINTGPVSGVADVNDRSNIAGAGINMAQRVMSIGDAGHILLSKRAAEDLLQYRHWEPHLHDLGEFEVKHGVKISIVNLYTEGLGNPQLPERLKQFSRRQAAHRRLKRMLGAGLLLLAVALFVSALFFLRRTPSNLTGSSVSPIPEKSIAVLPFENLSQDKANAYFAEGIQEEILTRLAKIADLKVISRTSTQNYKSKPGNLSEIAKQLGVANILEGSVQKTADQVRVNVQLIHAPSDSHRWADTYDRKLIDIFAVESEVAKAIAESLQAKLSVREEQALAVKPTNNPEAYDAYLRGLAFDARSWYSSDPLDKAASFYERAVQLDPSFALPWGRLSRVEAFRYFTGEDTTPARRDAAERALNIAQKLQPNAPETMLAQAFYQYWILRDYELAKETFGRARKLLPGNTEIPSALAAIARRQGHWEESIAQWEQTLALDPRNSAWLTQEAITFMVLRQFPAALKTFDRALDIVPNDPDLIEFKAQIYQAEGDLEQAGKLLAQISSPAAFGTKIYQLFLERRYDEAIRLLQVKPAESRSAYSQITLAFAQQLAGDTTAAKVAAQQAREKLGPLCQKDPANPQLAEMLSQAYALLGQKADALKEAERARTLLPSAKDAMEGPYYEENLARIQARIGDRDSAIAALQHLLTVPHGYVPTTPALLRLDPEWDPLRGDPRFEKLCSQKQP
jgi:TolB-like protein/Tfp pilus assembly protein PilF